MDVILLKKQRLVMSAVYNLCKDKRDCLVSLDEIMSGIKYKKRLVFKKAHESDAAIEPVADAAAGELVKEDGDAIQETATKKEKKLKADKKIEIKVREPVKQKEYIDEEPTVKGIIKKEKAIKFSELTDIIKQLAALEYFDVTEADSKEEKMYVISLLNKGKGFPLQERDRYVRIALKTGILIATPVVTTIVGLILKNLLTK